jgi:hypothetical protein
MMGDAMSYVVVAGAALTSGAGVTIHDHAACLAAITFAYPLNIFNPGALDTAVKYSESDPITMITGKVYAGAYSKGTKDKLTAAVGVDADVNGDPIGMKAIFKGKMDENPSTSGPVTTDVSGSLVNLFIQFKNDFNAGKFKSYIGGITFGPGV